MSRIIDKVFNAGNKIIRSIFKGSPNLITTADLNRQIEAIKYQLDRLDEKTGVISDMVVTNSLSSSELSVEVSFTYLVAKGCRFTPEVTPLRINLTKSAPIAYLCLVADEETVTYEDDFTHEISGAKFEDGTTLPAANHIVYKNERLVLTHALSNVGNLVAVLTAFILSDAGNLIVRNNVIGEKDSLVMHQGGNIVDFNSSLFGKVANGKSYDEAFSIIENRFSNIASTWTPLVKRTSNGEVSSDILFRIQSGIMYLNIPHTEIKPTLQTVAEHSSVIKLGDFPSGVRSEIIALLKRLDFDTRDNFMTSSGSLLIPYGDIGSFYAFSKDVVMGADGDVQYYPTSWLFKVSLILEYTMDEQVGVTLSNAFIGAYAYGYRQETENNNRVEQQAVVEYVELTMALLKAELIIPRTIGVIPLFGPSL